MGNRFDDSITVVATGAVIATSNTSTQVAIPNALSGEKPRYIRVAATAAACMRIGRTTAVATSADMQVQPGDSVILHVPLGLDVIAVIQVSGPGAFQISPLENM